MLKFLEFSGVEWYDVTMDFIGIFCQYNQELVRRETMTKRIISFALALIMTCALLPNMFVSAATIPDGKGPKEIEGGQRDFL